MIEEIGKKQELVSKALLTCAGKATRDVSSQKIENSLEALEERGKGLEMPHDRSLEVIKAKKEEGKSCKEIAKEMKEKEIPCPVGTKGNLWTSMSPLERTPFRMDWTCSAVNPWAITITEMVAIKLIKPPWFGAARQFCRRVTTYCSGFVPVFWGRRFQRKGYANQTQ